VDAVVGGAPVRRAVVAASESLAAGIGQSAIRERVAGGEDGERVVRFAANLTMDVEWSELGLAYLLQYRHGSSCTWTFRGAAQKIEVVG
jgi:hypothetical protein